MEKNFKKGIFVTAGILLLLIFAILSVRYIMRSFRLRKVVINSEESDIKGLDFLNNRILLFLDIEKTRNYLKGSNSKIRRMEIKVRHPDSVELVISMRKPYILLDTPFYREQLDEEGYRVDGNSQTDASLPVYRGESNLTLGDKADWRIRKALDYIRIGRQKSIFIIQITENDNNTFSLKTGDGYSVLVPQTADPQTIIASLQIITARFRIEGKLIRSIDFTVEKPVVTLAE